MAGLGGDAVQRHAGGCGGGGVPGAQAVAGDVLGGQPGGAGAAGDDLGGRVRGNRLAGFRVLVAKDAEQGLAMVAKDRPRMIISD